MKTLLISTYILMMMGCGNQPSQPAVSQSASIKSESTTLPPVRENDIEQVQDSTNDDFEGGNDIRFKDWTEKEWYDNDYYRTLRKYIDSYTQGKIENNNLTTYKSTLKSKFVIYNSEPFIGGGMFVSIIFLDNPNIIFDAWIYSQVDETTKKVSNYQVKGLRPRTDQYLEMTKEDIHAIIKEHPENKLW